MKLTNIDLFIGMAYLDSIKNDKISVMCIGEASGISRGLRDTTAEDYVAPIGLESVLASKLDEELQVAGEEYSLKNNYFALRNESNIFKLTLDATLLNNASHDTYGLASKYVNSDDYYFYIPNTNDRMPKDENCAVTDFYIKGQISDYVKADDTDRKVLVNVSDESLPSFQLSNVETETNELGETIIVKGSYTFDIFDNGTKRENVTFNFEAPAGGN
jgi:hypothetical protein